MLQLGLMYVASALKKTNDVSFEDLSCYKIFDACRYLKEEYSQGILCFTGTSLDIPTVNKMADVLCEQFHIVVGGAGATLSPEFYNYNVHTIVQNEAESIISNVIEEILGGSKERYFKADKFIDDLDTISFPARELLKKQGGNIFLDSQYDGESTLIAASRGCPYNCAFCASSGIWNRSLRERSAGNVIQEIIEIKRYGVNRFRFVDDSITTKRGWLQELCEEINKLDWPIYWRASIRVLPNDVELFQMMRDSGCIEVSFGVESGDQDVLNLLDKKIKVNDSRDALVNAYSTGLKTRVLMMMGLPGTTPETTDKDIEFLDSVPYTSLALKTFVPLPGSDIWKYPDKYGVSIIDKDLEKYNFFINTSEGESLFPPLIKLDTISGEELMKNKRKLLDYAAASTKLNRG